MNPVVGYLPVWLTAEQESEYKQLLEEHYKVEYFDFEELPAIHAISYCKSFKVMKSQKLVDAFYFVGLDLWTCDDNMLDTYPALVKLS